MTDAGWGGERPYRIDDEWWIGARVQHRPSVGCTSAACPPARGGLCPDTGVGHSGHGSGTARQLSRGHARGGTEPLDTTARRPRGTGSRTGLGDTRETGPDGRSHRRLGRRARCVLRSARFHRDRLGVNPTNRIHCRRNPRKRVIRHGGADRRSRPQDSHILKRCGRQPTRESRVRERGIRKSGIKQPRPAAVPRGQAAGSSQASATGSWRRS